MQLLAKFKQILHMGFRATLNFQKFKVALNPMYRFCLNFAKSLISSCLLKFYNKKKRTKITAVSVKRRLRTVYLLTESFTNIIQN